MKIKIQKISGSVLYVILAITLVIVGLFFLGGEDLNPIVPDMSQPVYTDSLIYWVYALLSATIVITLVAAIYQFAMNFIHSPKDAIKSLFGIVILMGVLIVSWSIGDAQPLSMPGYSGADNVAFWLKITDMFLYTIYIMMALLILLIFGFGVAKKLK